MRTRVPSTLSLRRTGMLRLSTRGVTSLALLLVLAAGAVACSRVTETPRSATPASATEPAEEPKYEAAYPADVSSEALSEKDTAQQAKPHRHDGTEEHTHGDKEKEGGHGHPH